MDKRLRSERGVALVVAIVGLAVIGALITAVFVPTLMDRKMADNTVRTVASFSAAEYGLEETAATWNAEQWNLLAVSDSLLINGTLPGGGGTYNGTIRRINPDMFYVQVAGMDDRGRTQQRLGQLMKLDVFDMDIDAALTTRGPTTFGGAAEVNGNDTHPASWTSCGLPDSTKAGLRIQDTDDITTSGNNCNNMDCIDGNPPVVEDTTISDSTFFVYGDVTWDDLVDMATLIIPSGTYQIEPSVSGSFCNSSDIRNWGDPFNPTSPCFSRMPIIYAPGDLNINGKFGQGILLVEGDLSVQGGFDFFGVTIVKGVLKTFGTGGHFNGAVFAPNVDLDDITVLGDALVQFSSCAIMRAMATTAPAKPLRSRGWLHAF